MTDHTYIDRHGPPEETRRDFLVLAASALGVIGAAVTAWPFIDSLNPAADTIAAGAPIDIDLAPVKPGQQIIVSWRGRPVFIVHRTPEQLKMLQAKQDTSLLADPDSTVGQQPPYAQNWHRSINPQYLVVVGICTHLGCIPEFQPEKGGFLGANWPGGYFCPCHGSKYDLSARVFAGVPAPYNLPVPPYHFPGKTSVRIGENPKDVAWDFSSIVQI
ncbi:MAG TPA: ubiquinol-cytochrome c reductase iron-sulfur subunit [Stellaceae bacterium]|nr:ubiquinol-cytochrome c reductase iron-sulfur subunit [Stellaceae bacterium]